MNKWDAKFGFFWYNDEELFEFTKKDFEEKARRMSQVGINIVMTFSCTHFRWSFKEHWKLINNSLKSIVDACHKYGIKVVEHHSSHLTWDPLDSDDWEYVESILIKRHSSRKSWEGLDEYISKDTEKGTENFRQIDGRTGGPARSNYNGWCMCFNSEEYRKAYFDYLEKLYNQTGIDGIMTDDVQYFAKGHSCACDYCKKIFKDDYGYELPDPDEWEKFHGDFDNPAYIAWERFRRESTRRFQNDVNKHFTELGYEMLRPNYQSSCINHNWTAYPFEKALNLWDWVFQENCFSYVIKHSWPQFLTESRHRFNMGRLKNIPSMSMFYPDRYDSFYFSWALAMAWGQMFTATPEGEDMSEIEGVFREFEKKHSKLLFNQQKKADITIYWSYETANFCNPENCSHITAVKSWSQALTFAGYSTDMVFSSEDHINGKIHKCLLVPDVMMMSDAEYKKITLFAEKGGVVILTGRPGVKKSDGSYRTVEEMQAGLKIPKDLNAEVYNLGLGKIVMFAETGMDNLYYNPHSINRFKDKDLKKSIPEYIAPEMADIVNNLIGTYVDKKVVVKTENPLLNSYFSYDSDYSNMLIHLINADETINCSETEAGHNDTIPAFVMNSKKSIEAEIIVKNENIGKAYLLSVEIPEEKELEVKTDDNMTVVIIQKGLVSGYAIIRLPL